MTLADLKSAPLTHKSYIFAPDGGAETGIPAGVFFFRSGDFTGRTDVIVHNDVAVSQGALVPQDASGVRFRRTAAPQTAGRWMSVRPISHLEILDNSTATPAQVTAAIQAAINTTSNGEVYIPEGTWTVEPQKHDSLDGTFGANSVCLRPRSNLHLYGPGIIKLADGKGGASGAIIGNWDGAPIENVRIQCQIDGNRDMATGTMSGIVLVNASNCTVRGGWIKRVSFCGAQMAKSSVSCTVQDVFLSDIGYIGIQFQRAHEGKVLDCKIYNTVDNAIDFECDGALQDQNIISRNVGAGCASFVFLESGGNTIVTDNSAKDINEAGIWINRINTGSENNRLSGNRFQRGSGVGRRGGIYSNNVCGKSIIAQNFIEGFDYGMIFEGSTNYLAIEPNYFKNIGKALYGISRQETALVKSLIRQPWYEGPLNGRFPFTVTPLTSPTNFPGRTFAVKIENMWDLDGNGPRAGSIEDEYVSAVGTLSANNAWQNAFSIFTNGETLIYQTGVALTPGYSIRINGVFFLIARSLSDGVYALKSISGEKGDFTPVTNGAYSWREFWPEWLTL